MILISLLEKNHHRVADVKANVAAVIVSDRVTALLDHETVPVPLIPAIKLFLYLASDIREVIRLMALKRSQCSDNRMLNLILTHVRSLNQNTLISCAPKLL